MRLRIKSDLIRSVAESWKRQYWHPGRGWSKVYRKEEIYRRLSDLSEQATEDGVKAIIGNYSWTTNRCDECGKDVDVTVMLGQEPDYESQTVFVCLDCLEKAIALVEGMDA